MIGFVIENRILSIDSVLCAFFPIFLFYHVHSIGIFILHLLYDVFVSLNARRPTASDWAKVINPLYVNKGTQMSNLLFGIL